MELEITKGHLKFVEEAIEGSEGHWAILNKKDNGVLGDICWYKPWRKHVAYFRKASIFDEGCLSNIAEFLEELDDDKAS